ncbi:MAG: hypothetical protein ACOVOJ_09560, partial [Pirellula sp.]
IDGVFGMDHPLMENSECAGRKLRRTIQCTICGGVGDWTVLTLLTVLTGLTVVRRQSRQIAAAVRRPGASKFGPLRALRSGGRL